MTHLRSGLAAGKLLRLDSGVDDEGSTERGDGKLEEAAETGVGAGVREACAYAAGVYIAGQRVLLQLGIAECKARLYAAAAATSRLRTSLDWRSWDYTEAVRARKRKGPRVRVTAHAQQATLDVGMAPGCGQARHSAGASQLLQRTLGQQAELSVGVVRATSDVPAGGAVLAVPRMALITADAAFGAGEWGEALQTVGGIDEDAVLMLFLIHERNRTTSSSDDGGGSGWVAAFFAELEALAAAGEATACPPYTWRASDRESLIASDSEAGRLADEAAVGLDDLYDALFPALSDALPECFPAKVYTVAALRWAAGVLAVYSVQLRVPGGDGLLTAVVPLVAAAPRHRADAAAFHEYDPLTDSYVLRTLRGLRCGEEVAVCYGRGGSPAARLAEVGVVSAASCAEEEHDGVALKVRTKGGEAAAVRLGVASEGGGLLVWPPRLAEQLEPSELSKAAGVHRRKALAAMDSTLGESAVVQAGRTLSGEAMVLCRERLRLDLAVLEEVQRSIHPS